MPSGALPGIIEGPGMLEQGDQLLATFRPGLAEHSARVGGGRGIGGFEQANHGECQLLLLQIGAQALAGQSFLAPDVQDVVGNLEGDSQVTTIAVECLGRGLVGPRVVGTQPAGDCGQLGRLALDDREIRTLIQIKVAALMDLMHLSLADPVRRAADPAARQSRIERGRQVECVGKKVISEQDSRLVSPFGVDRAACPRRQEQQGWTQSLALIVTAMINELLNERELTPKLMPENTFGLCELASDRSEQVCKCAPSVLNFERGSTRHTRSPLQIPTFEPLTPQRSGKSGRCRVPRFHARLSPGCPRPSWAGENDPAFLPFFHRAGSGRSPGFDPPPCTYRRP